MDERIYLPSRNPIKNFLYTAPAYQLLLLPVLLFSAVFFSFFMFLGAETITKIIIFGAFFLILTFSRYYDIWEYGIELYNFIIFSFAFAFGPIFALAFSFASFLPIPFFQIKGVGGHHATKTLLGPFIQNATLALISVLGGLAGMFLFDFSIANIILVSHVIIFFSDYVIGNILRIKFTPLKWDRIFIYTVLSLTINYQIFFHYGIPFVEFLQII